MTLYSIDAEIASLINRMFAEADEETGEVNPDILEELEQLKQEREEKVENIGLFVKNLTAEAKAIKEEMDNLKSRYESISKKAGYLESYLSNDLISNNQTKFETARIALSFRKSESVNITDESILQKKFLVKKVEFKPDKKAIKEALKNGEKVKGAVLEEKQNLQIK